MRARRGEKSMRHGHPSIVHLWWVPRQLAAARAVIIAQFVDDPSGYLDELCGDLKLQCSAEVRRKASQEACKFRDASIFWFQTDPP